MAKNKVSEWSSTAASNTDVGGIDIAEGCAPSGINNAIRELMAQVKDMQTGTDADNLVVGGTLTVTGATTLTSLSLNGNTTLGDVSSDTLTVNATPTFNVAIPVASGGTGVTTSTGSGNLVLSTSPTLVTPALGTPTALVGTNITGTAASLTVGNATNATNATNSTTQVAGTNNTTIATTAFVQNEIGTLGTMASQDASAVAITGGTITGLSSALPVASGGTGVTTSTGSGANVLGTSPVLTTPTINSAQVSTVSGTAPLFMCRAWVNFNGTTGTINASGNVASITKNGTGDYTITFTTALPDANYVWSASGCDRANTATGNETPTFKTTSAYQVAASLRIKSYYNSRPSGTNYDNGVADLELITVAIFR